MTINDILVTIDRAVDDYEVSADAMRWKPEPVVEPQSFGLTLPPDAIPYSVSADVQPFLDAIRRDVRDLVRIYGSGAYPREWLEWWEDAAPQADRR